MRQHTHSSKLNGTFGKFLVRFIQLIPPVYINIFQPMLNRPLCVYKL